MDDFATIVIEGNCLYTHQVIRVNYTTYDNRREQDVINPRSRPHAMVLAKNSDNEHPYWYAEVLSIFHLRVRHLGQQSKSTEVRRIDAAFVRWLDLDEKCKGGWKAQRLQRIGYLDSNADAFGFLNPNLIIRGVHLIPAFDAGATENYLKPSKLGRPYAPKDDHTDWLYYYIGM